MNTIYYLAILTVLFYGCKKTPVTTEQIVKNLTVTPKNADADGTSVIDVSCELNSDATSDRKEILFKISSGMFAENKDQKIIKKAEFENGVLLVRTQIVVPQRAGKIIITAEPNNAELKQDYILKDSVILLRSNAATIKAETDSFAVSSNFKSDVQITGVLLNGNGRKVSNGTRVLFEDFFAGGNPVSGRYRNVSASSNSDSKVFCTYSPGYVPVGSNIYIKITVLDDAGNKTNIRDSVFINVNN